MPTMSDHDDVSQNERAARELRARIAARDTMALVGAGASVAAGYPTWSHLLWILDREARRTAGNGAVPDALLRTNDVLWRAEELRRVLGDDVYRGVLRREFAPKHQTVRAGPAVGAPDAPAQVLQNIVGLPFRHVLTTNYDVSLEDAHRVGGLGPHQSLEWSNPSDLDAFLASVCRTDASRAYLHVHGRWDVPERMILTESDYAERYLHSADASRLLFGLFATQTFVFVGFSVADPEFQYLLRQAKAAVRPARPRHFAILAIRQEDAGDDATLDEYERVERRRLNAIFGIEPVFYVADEEHKELAPLLAGLRDGAQPAELTVRPSPAVVPAERGARARAAREPRFQLAASVRPAEGRGFDGWFELTLTVTAKRSHRLVGPVVFRLHPTFSPSRRSVDPTMGGRKAELKLLTYGAFIVRARVNGGEETLELNLATLRNAPREFLES